MSSPTSTDHRAAAPPHRDAVADLIARTQQLRCGLEAVRREALGDDPGPQGRWRQALLELTALHLGAVDEHLAQLREGQPVAASRTAHGRAGGPVGSAEWNLLTDETRFSPPLYELLGRDPAIAPPTLDELPSLMHPRDRPALAAMIGDCLIDGQDVEGDLRVLRPDGRVRTVHLRAEPVLDADGTTASVWMVLRDVGELRRGQRAVRESGAALGRHRHTAVTEHRIAAELREAVLPPWRASLRLPRAGAVALDVAARSLPASARPLGGGDWYDALQLPGGDSLFAAGELTGQGITSASGRAVLLGALRGLAAAGMAPGRILAGLAEVLDACAQPTLGSVVCCRYAPTTRRLTWTHAGRPGLLLFRGGTGRPLAAHDGAAPGGTLLGALTAGSYEQAEETLLPGDLLMLYTDTLVPGRVGPGAQSELLALAPRFAGAVSAQDCVRTVAEAFGSVERADDASVLMVRITD